ncbi:MAG: efflux RND transporter periplasmic adaptor subunit [Lysobacterales bacterium]
MMIRLAALTVILASLSACGSSAPPTRDAAPLPQLPTLTITPESTARERVWDGVVEAVNQATLSAQTAGRVLELPFDVDDYVPAGAVVVRFTDVEQQSASRQAQAQLRAAEAAAREAESEYTRIQSVYERKLVAKAQLDQATARRDSARAALEAARAGVRSAGEQVDYTVIRAPFSGIVTARHVQIGESVRPGQQLISGLSLGQLRLAVEVPQSDIAAIRDRKQASVLLGSDGARRIAATSVTVFPYADPNTHSFKVRIELPEEETGLHPGMTVKVAFDVGSSERLLLPRSALVQRSEVSAVYVLDQQQLSLRQLRLGHAFGDRVEVLAGLSGGETIVTDPLAAAAALVSRRADHE